MVLPRYVDRTRVLALGEVVADRYRVLGFLGSGGMGEVYEVEHLHLGKPFALKLLKHEFADDPETRVRFTREARSMAAIESDHVVEIVDFGEGPSGMPYFVMQRLRGCDLRQHLAESGPLSVAQVASIGVDACRGLQAVHAAGIVHRDLKPANLFLSRVPYGRHCCKLLDFGVAKSLTGDSTHQGPILGTIRYMAPEQVEERGRVGPWTDIYALGAVLYECLAGQAPFSADAVERLLFKILNEAPTPLQQLHPEFPADLCAAVMRALSRDPKQRFGSSGDFADALGSHAEAPRLSNELRAVTDRTVAVGSARTRVRWRGIVSLLLTILSLTAFSGAVGWRIGSHADRGDEHRPVLVNGSSESDSDVGHARATMPWEFEVDSGSRCSESTESRPVPPSKPAKPVAHSPGLGRPNRAPTLLPDVDTENPYAN